MAKRQGWGRMRAFTFIRAEVTRLRVRSCRAKTPKLHARRPSVAERLLAPVFRVELVESGVDAGLRATWLVSAADAAATVALCQRCRPPKRSARRAEAMTDALTWCQDQCDTLVAALQANADALHRCERTPTEAAEEIAAIAARAIAAADALPEGSLAEELARVERAREENAEASEHLNAAVKRAHSTLTSADDLFKSHARAALGMHEAEEERGKETDGGR